MNVLVIVNVSPWGGSLGLTALRLTRAMLGQGAAVDAVFFRDDGVYQALPGRASDSGTPDLAAAWRALSGEYGIPLLLCSSASQRRLPGVPEGFREAGLVEVLERAGACDRLVTF